MSFSDAREPPDWKFQFSQAVFLHVAEARGNMCWVGIGILFAGAVAGVAPPPGREGEPNDLAAATYPGRPTQGRPFGFQCRLAVPQARDPGGNCRNMSTGLAFRLQEIYGRQRKYTSGTQRKGVSLMKNILAIFWPWHLPPSSEPAPAEKQHALRARAHAVLHMANVIKVAREEVLETRGYAKQMDPGQVVWNAAERTAAASNSEDTLLAAESPLVESLTDGEGTAYEATSGLEEPNQEAGALSNGKAGEVSEEEVLAYWQLAPELTTLKGQAAVKEATLKLTRQKTDDLVAQAWRTRTEEDSQFAGFAGLHLERAEKEFQDWLHHIHLAELEAQFATLHARMQEHLPYQPLYAVIAASTTPFDTETWPAAGSEAVSSEVFLSDYREYRQRAAELERLLKDKFLQLARRNGLHSMITEVVQSRKADDPKGNALVAQAYAQAALADREYAEWLENAQLGTKERDFIKVHNRMRRHLPSLAL